MPSLPDVQKSSLDQIIRLFPLLTYFQRHGIKLIGEYRSAPNDVSAERGLFTLLTFVGEAHHD